MKTWTEKLDAELAAGGKYLIQIARSAAEEADRLNIQDEKVRCCVWTRFKGDIPKSISTPALVDQALDMWPEKLKKQRARKKPCGMQRLWG